ncbi:Glucan 1,3-beta-glucosidase 3 [Orbilia oligospora]|uniref:Glucan 1,3-beta-glucosidase 3 n=1 Tax=Orbilia oligospora TaxID=2813651 RepID=A0A8H8UXR6_ORBOL|nr:Glucan 1,3-beta-glucosidase 3 [Orbilia oligospora]
MKRSKVPLKNPITGEPIDPPSGKVEIKGHSVLLGARLRRSFLYVPAHNERFLEKALKSAADCIVFDLEDGVAPSEKKQARENLKNLWERLATEGYRIGENQGADLCLRINHEGWLGPKQWEGPSKKIQAPSLEIDQDLDLLALRNALKLGVNVVAPKVNFPYDIRNIRELVLQKQKAVVDPSRKIKRLEIIPTIETALATLNLGLFTSHAKQFSAMVFASEDYCASMGIPRAQDHSNMLFARSQLVCQDFKDLSILEKECEEGVYLGFEGKQAIHPDQIETINRIFSPKIQEVEWAKALLEAVEKNKTDEPLERDVLAYRYHHGTNLGAIFVAEKWLYGNLFPEGVTGDSELDAVKAQVNLHGIDSTRQLFETFWSTTMTPEDWVFLANKASVTTVRLPIGYFSLGPDFCRSTPFEKYSRVYTNSWLYIKQYIVSAASHGIATLIDLHALPGGANSDSHSGSSSHKAELWGNSKNLKLAIECLKFIAHETKEIPFVIGLQLVNEAVYGAHGMYEFYDQVINELGRINPHLNVYISDAWDINTALQYSIKMNARGGCSVVVDTHKYYTFAEEDKKLNPHQIIDKVNLAEVENNKGKGAAVVIGEYSCVMDGRSWGNIQGNERKELATRFGKKQTETWWRGCGGSFFWTYKMAWMPGGEWGFSEQTNNGAVPAPPLATADNTAVQEGIFKASRSREDLKNASMAQHTNYWNHASPGQYFEHHRLNRTGGGITRTGADRIGMLDLWVKRRELEYETLEVREKGRAVDKRFLWEFGHGLRQGIKDFEHVVGFC